MTRKIPLADWAELHYAPPPSAWTLRQWVRAGQIVPAPEKVGKAYYVAPDAKRMTDATPRGAMARFLEEAEPA
jgi:predicted site-specific integrase-resolvase